MPLYTNFQHSVTKNDNDNIFFDCNKRIKQELAEHLIIDSYAKGSLSESHYNILRETITDYLK